MSDGYFENKRLERVKIGDLEPAAYNPRRLTKKEFGQIQRSIEKFGFVEPVVANSNPDRMNIIIGGHQRVKVAKSLGMKEVPVFYINLSEADERELNIRLNKNTGGWDFDALANQFELPSLVDWGFAPEEFGIVEDPKENQDSGPKEPKSATCPECGKVFDPFKNRNKMEK